MTSRSVFITGAARGIGRATAERFARAGWFVGLYDVDAAGVAATAAEIGGAGTTVHGVLDVTDPEAWGTCLKDFAAEAGGRLDVLVNNAGILASGNLAELPLARQAAIVDVNLKGVLYGCHAAFPYLQDTPGSCVVNLCSASALYGQPGLAIYSATKAAIRSLTESLDLEWAPAGVRVCDVLPLFVATDMGTEAVAERFKLLGVHLTADDVARAVFAAAERPSRFGPHRLVGVQTKAAGVLGRLGPTWVTRTAVKRLAR